MAGQGYLYKMIYWSGINIGDWRFYADLANIKSAILFQSEHAQWHVAQNHKYKICQLTTCTYSLHGGFMNKL